MHVFDHEPEYTAFEVKLKKNLKKLDPYYIFNCIKYCFYLNCERKTMKIVEMEIPIKKPKILCSI